MALWGFDVFYCVGKGFDAGFYYGLVVFLDYILWSSMESYLFLDS